MMLATDGAASFSAKEGAKGKGGRECARGEGRGGPRGEGRGAWGSGR